MLTEMFKSVTLYPRFKMPAVAMVAALQDEKTPYFDRKAGLPGVGWVGIDLGSRATVETTTVEPYTADHWNVAGLAVGIKRAPAGLVRAEVQAAFKMHLREFGKLTRKQKKEITNRVKAFLNERAQLSIAWVPVAWRDEARCILIGSASVNALDGACAAINQLHAANAELPWAAAASPERAFLATQDMQPTSFGTKRSTAETVEPGREFCTWLLWRNLSRSGAWPDLSAGATPNGSPVSFQVSAPVKMCGPDGKQAITITDRDSNQWAKDVPEMIRSGHLVSRLSLTLALAPDVIIGLQFGSDGAFRAIKPVKWVKERPAGEWLEAVSQACLLVNDLVFSFMALRKNATAWAAEREALVRWSLE